MAEQEGIDNNAGEEETASIAEQPKEEPAISDSDDSYGEAQGKSEKEILSESQSVARAREVTANTIVRLMGLPTANDLRVLESKIDSLNSKVTSISVKVDRITTQVLDASHDSDRVDLHIADLRAFVKKGLTSVVTEVERIARHSIDAERNVEGHSKVNGNTQNENSLADTDASSDEKK